MGRTPQYRFETTAGAKSPPAAGGPFIRINPVDIKIVPAHAKVLLRISQGRGHQFCDGSGCLVRDKFKGIERGKNILTADDIHHPAYFPGRNWDKARVRANVSSHLSLAPSYLSFNNMTPISSGRGEFAQPVPHHILSDINGDMPPPIMDGDCMPNHLGEDGARPTPGANNPLIALIIHHFNLFQ
jgi:hypothetical protein